MSSLSQLKQQTFSKAIVYGTISYQLGQNKKATDRSTHRWCVYVRGPNGEDISTFIDKVVFVLHETFPDYQRAITKPPFEVAEKGWGEFDILIQIHFKSHYPHLELVHKLKFYGAKTGGNSQSSKKPVVSEFYDEIVFVNPSVDFYELLKEVRFLNISNEKESIDKKDQMQIEDEVLGANEQKAEDEEGFDWKQHYLKFDANDHKMKLEDALAVIKLENEKCKAECDKYDKDIESLNLEIDALQKEHDIAQAKQKEEQEKQQLLIDQEALLPPPSVPFPPAQQKAEPPQQPIFYPNNEIPAQQLQQQVRPPRVPSNANTGYLPPQQGLPIQGGIPAGGYNQIPPQQQQMIVQNQYPPQIPPQ